MLNTLIYYAGWFQIILALGSISIPFLLKWKEEMSKVSQLMRSIFTTYSVYILVTNIWFGIISILFPSDLIDGSNLAKAVTLFIFLYWLGRVLVQFIFGKAEGRPAGWIFTIGEWGLWLLFIFLTAIYGYAALINFHLL